MNDIDQNRDLKDIISCGAAAITDADMDAKIDKKEINEPGAPEDMDQEELSLFMIDMAHRIAVHHTLWFREVEHQLGYEKAVRVMDSAWDRIRRLAVKRLSEELCFNESDGIPEPVILMPQEKKLSLSKALAKNWLMQDGVWFQAVESEYGMNEAKRCNDSTWARFSPFEAHCIARLLKLSYRPGLTGLLRALNFRLYGRVNAQRGYFTEDGKSLIFEMNECRVQSARKRKGLEDYPCKSAGLVEYSRFAEAIDDRIRTECLGCPPDSHPESWHCAWRFYIEDAANQ